MPANKSNEQIRREATKEVINKMRIVSLAQATIFGVGNPDAGKFVKELTDSIINVVESSCQESN
ncbi:hypothetical protein EWD37_18795 [Salmonella enterica subsp. enterica serovar Javiana]|uniref:Uncharacterized protein n=1 Tax=Citrobacter freundii TaxID=546 RepID=A0A9P3ZA91_CITFR|nr:hypothetical protein [Citrobacter portucalensis]EAT3905758.1 hypothetical protein [Salmonella enterica]ECE8602208.1 hypothetical protein [Salmonella enterica subsp. enterica serovar Javiana]HAT2339689.1 hypothetical protein [Citrobacter freundii]EDS5712190.1 hypothetical protein [Salmonella enterica subsp. enterica serovar Javiana]EDU1442599.1 hypothetical protein [Salmonella enterica subsp. enterica serovar Javiana]